MTSDDIDDTSDAPAYLPLTIDMTAYYAVQEPAASFDEAPDLVFAFHGYGQSAASFLRRFRPWRERNLLVVAPQGPHQSYLDWESRKVGFVWMTMFERERAIECLMAYIHQLIGHLRESHKFTWRRMYLLGFSQGATVAWRFATRGGVPIDGLVCCGADLPPDAAERLPATHRFPVRLVHGREDNIMSFTLAEQSLAKLMDLGYDVTTDFFEGEHRIPPEQVQAIGDWIQQR